jgi:hypothetical protein
VSRASVRTFILTQHLTTLDQGTKRNVFQFSFVPYLEWQSSRGHNLIRSSEGAKDAIYMFAAWCPKADH